MPGDRTLQKVRRLVRVVTIAYSGERKRNENQHPFLIEIHFDGWSELPCVLRTLTKHKLIACVAASRNLTQHVMFVARNTVCDLRFYVTRPRMYFTRDRA